MLPSCEHLYSTDYRWFAHHIGSLTRDYEGNLWTQSKAWPEKTPPESWGINCMEGDTQADGLSTEPNVLSTGQNSGFAAVNLAYHIGGGAGTRIILLGYDMMMDGAKRHWFGAHPKDLEVNSNYANFIQHFGKIDCKSLGIEIWNCTRRTALTCFPQFALEDLMNVAPDS